MLIKDNHVDAGGGVMAVVTKARSLVAQEIGVQVEVRTLAELQSAMEAKADMVLLDNMSLDEMREAVLLCRGKAITEASGGINLSSVKSIAESGVDLISVGALTHSAPDLDLSLDIR